MFVKGNVWSWVKPDTYVAPTSDLGRKYVKVASIESDIWLHLPRFVKMVVDGDAKKVIEDMVKAVE